jgi:hypothetical protein
MLQASSINIRDEVHSLKAAVNQLQMTSTNALSVVTSAQSLSNNLSAESAAPAAASFASLAKNLQSAPGIQLASTSKKPARRATAVCGKATGKSLLVVDGIHRVDIFVRVSVRTLRLRASRISLKIHSRCAPQLRSRNLRHVSTPMRRSALNYASNVHSLTH